MQCIILAAGYGSRMGDLTQTMPKPMLRIKGRPLLEYKVHVLPQDVTEIIFVVGHMCDHIMNYFGSHYAGRTVRYALQSEMRGTADALAAARHLIRSDRFMVLMGDDLYVRDDLAELARHRLAILGHNHDNAQGKGVIIADEDGRLVSVRENFPEQRAGLVNAGAYMLTQDFFAYTPANANNGHAQEVGLPQTLAQMTDKHDVMIHRATAWLPITAPHDLARAEARIHEFL